MYNWKHYILKRGDIMKINSILKQDFHTIHANDSINKALDFMNESNINGMPVVDDDKNLVGMVVKADIYRFMVHPGHYVSCPVEWVMSKTVIVAQSNEDLFTVARRLRKNDIVAMPVVENDKIIGIISIEDLLDYFLNIDSQSESSGFVDDSSEE
jgi:CBS domain-containing protein